MKSFIVAIVLALCVLGAVSCDKTADTSEVTNTALDDTGLPGDATPVSLSGDVTPAI
jgi:hypothetical protein